MLEAAKTWDSETETPIPLLDACWSAAAAGSAGVPSA